jgi:hypothetical protein
MQDSEIFQFTDCFRGLTRIFHWRGDEDDLRQTAGSYFKVLRKYPMPAVKAGADACVERYKHFPKPVEWMDVIPRHVETVELPVMGQTEADTWMAAMKSGCEGDLCHCLDCRQARADHLPLRFVPDEARAIHPRDGRAVQRGHWAHGEELKRWWVARNAFFGLRSSLSGALRAMPHVSRSELTAEAQRMDGGLMTPKKTFSRFGHG